MDSDDRADLLAKVLEKMRHNANARQPSSPPEAPAEAPASENEDRSGYGGGSPMAAPSTDEPRTMRGTGRDARDDDDLGPPSSEPTVVRHIEDEPTFVRGADIRVGHRDDELPMIDPGEIEVHAVEIDFDEFEQERTHDSVSGLHAERPAVAAAPSPTGTPPPAAVPRPAYAALDPESVPDWPDIEPLPAGLARPPSDRRSEPSRRLRERHDAPASAPDRGAADEANPKPVGEANATAIGDATEAAIAEANAVGLVEAPAHLPDEAQVSAPVASEAAASSEPAQPAERAASVDAPPAPATPNEADAGPISERKPIEERLDDGFAELDDDERPPESGEVASQRKPTIPASAAPHTHWDDEATADGEVSGALRDAAAGLVAAPGELEMHLVAELAPGGPEPLEIRAIVTRPAPITGDAAAFVGAVQSFRPQTFGELLDASLALGASDPE